MAHPLAEEMLSTIDSAIADVTRMEDEKARGSEALLRAELATMKKMMEEQAAANSAMLAQMQELRAAAQRGDDASTLRTLLHVDADDFSSAAVPVPAVDERVDCRTMTSDDGIAEIAAELAAELKAEQAEQRATAEAAERTAAIVAEQAEKRAAGMEEAAVAEKVRAAAVDAVRAEEAAAAAAALRADLQAVATAAKSRGVPSAVSTAAARIFAANLSAASPKRPPAPAAAPSRPVAGIHVAASLAAANSTPTEETTLNVAVPAIAVVEEAGSNSIAATKEAEGKEEATKLEAQPFDLRRELIEFFERHEPSKVTEVDAIIAQHSGRPDELLALITERYMHAKRTLALVTQSCAAADEHEAAELRSAIATAVQSTVATWAALRNSTNEVARAADAADAAAADAVAADAAAAHHAGAADVAGVSVDTDTLREALRDAATRAAKAVVELWASQKDVASEASRAAPAAVSATAVLAAAPPAASEEVEGVADEVSVVVVGGSAPPVSAADPAIVPAQLVADAPITTTPAAAAAPTPTPTRASAAPVPTVPIPIPTTQTTPVAPATISPAKLHPAKYIDWHSAVEVAALKKDIDYLLFLREKEASRTRDAKAEAQHLRHQLERQDHALAALKSQSPASAMKVRRVRSILDHDRSQSPTGWGVDGDDFARIGVGSMGMTALRPSTASASASAATSGGNQPVSRARPATAAANPRDGKAATAAPAGGRLVKGIRLGEKPRNPHSIAIGARRLGARRPQHSTRVSQAFKQPTLTTVPRTDPNALLGPPGFLMAQLPEPPRPRARRAPGPPPWRPGGRQHVKNLAEMPVSERPQGSEGVSERAPNGLSARRPLAQQMWRQPAKGPTFGAIHNDSAAQRKRVTMHRKRLEAAKQAAEAQKRTNALEAFLDETLREKNAAELPAPVENIGPALVPTKAGALKRPITAEERKYRRGRAKKMPGLFKLRMPTMREMHFPERKGGAAERPRPRARTRTRPRPATAQPRPTSSTSTRSQQQQQLLESGGPEWFPRNASPPSRGTKKALHQIGAEPFSLHVPRVATKAQMQRVDKEVVARLHALDAERNKLIAEMNAAFAKEEAATAVTNAAEQPSVPEVVAPLADPVAPLRMALKSGSGGGGGGIDGWRDGGAARKQPLASPPQTQEVITAEARAERDASEAHAGSVTALPPVAAKAPQRQAKKVASRPAVLKGKIAGKTAKSKRLRRRRKKRAAV
jgi:hypothetical protein